MPDVDTFVPSTSAPVQRGTGAEQRIDLEIAGIPLALLSTDEGVTRRLRVRFASSLGMHPRSDALITRVGLRDGPYNSEPPGTLSVGPAMLQLEEWDLSAWFDRGAAHGELHTSELGASGGRSLEYVVEVYLRLLVGMEIVKYSGILLHAASAVRDGLGYVFMGPSATGKSTVAASSDEIGLAVLSDDQSILRIEGNRLILHGVPFHGLYCPVQTTPAVVPLGGLYYLRQDTREYLEPVPPVIGAVLLAEQATFVSSHVEFADRVMETCDRIAQLAPINILHLRKGPAFWQIL